MAIDFGEYKKNKQGVKDLLKLKDTILELFPEKEMREIGMLTFMFSFCALLVSAQDGRIDKKFIKELTSIFWEFTKDIQREIKKRGQNE